MASTTVTPTPMTLGTFGQIVISCVGGGTACASQSLSGFNLFLTITQTAPTTGSAALPTGVLSGSISGTASSAMITWGLLGPAVIGDFQYSLLTTSLSLVPPSINQGTTSVQGTIARVATVPEPTTTAMLAAGLAGAALLARRRRRV